MYLCWTLKNQIYCADNKMCKLFPCTFLSFRVLLRHRCRQRNSRVLRRAMQRLWDLRLLHRMEQWQSYHDRRSYKVSLRLVTRKRGDNPGSGSKFYWHCGCTGTIWSSEQNLKANFISGLLNLNNKLKCLINFNNLCPMKKRKKMLPRQQPALYWRIFNSLSANGIT